MASAGKEDPGGQNQVLVERCRIAELTKTNVGVASDSCYVGTPNTWNERSQPCFGLQALVWSSQEKHWIAVREPDSIGTVNIYCRYHFHGFGEALQ